MKRLLLVIITAMITIYGCSDDTSTSPEPVEETPLAAATVGPSGGTLQIPDFVLTVPPGAFSSPAELTLYESEDDHGFGVNAVSRFFRLEGLPDSYSDTLTVSIGYTGTLSGEAYIAAGTEEEVITDDIELVTATFYTLRPAVESSGYLQSNLPPQDASLRFTPERYHATSKAAPGAARLGAVHNHESQSSEHIILKYPTAFSEFAEDLLGFFEAAHDTVVALGIGYEGKKWNWPVEAVIRNYESGAISVSVYETPQIILSDEKVTADNLPLFQVYAMNVMMQIGMVVPSPRKFSDADNICGTWRSSIGVVWSSAVHKRRKGRTISLLMKPKLSRDCP